MDEITRLPNGQPTFLGKLQSKKKELQDEIDVINKAIQVLEKNTDWDILFTSSEYC